MAFCLQSVTLIAQKNALDSVTDLPDFLKRIFPSKKPISTVPRIEGPSILPSFGYNPSFGFVIGAKMSYGKQLGNHKNTQFSVFGMEALYTSNGIITVQARHNVFTKENRWYLEGNWQLSRFGLIDYGLGTGSDHGSNSFIMDEFPTTNSDSSFPVRFKYFRLTEKVYKKVTTNLYVGAGVSFNYRNNIDDIKQTGIFNTPHQRYSVQNGYDPDHYNANGLLFSIQYNSREHPLRSYGGMYADLTLRFNQQWMGSTKNATQIFYDIRKYWSLSKRNPEQVIAVWHWASYLINGSLPYLEMPATGNDAYYRSGRAYTIGRFRGPSFAYFETEYRYPITRKKLISGVAFLNLQTASDNIDKKIYGRWEAGGGAGLRILMQKQSRTTMCIDIAKGNYGAWGIFFGLNEAF